MVAKEKTRMERELKIVKELREAQRKEDLKWLNKQKLKLMEKLEIK